MSMADAEAVPPSHSMRTRSMDQTGDHNSEESDRVTASMDACFYLQRAIHSDLAPSVMHSYRMRLETLRRCSYYLEVIRLDLPLGEHSYLSTSTILHLIDPWKLQRMKKLANSQVKIQLSLLEELYEQLVKGRQKLDTLYGCCDMPIGEAKSIRDQVTEVLRTKADFDAVVLPGRLHCKHQLIADMGSSKVPQVRLAMLLKMPVHFNKERSFATGSSASLYWHVAGSDVAVAQPQEQFELHYKLLQPTCAAEGTEVSVITCEAYSAQVEGLRPDRCYEFSIKRVDSCCLVYGFWNDSIILRTISTTFRGGNDCFEKRRVMFPW